MTDQVQAHVLNKYELIKKVGSGAYGHVWKVHDKKTGKILALKKIFDAFQHSTDAQRTYREIMFLYQFNHENIVKLLNVIRAQNDKDLYLVFEFMQADLHNAIGQKILKDIHNRYILYQIVKGIKYLHSAQVIHRDLKPSNILINSDCHLKICDFGLARSLVAQDFGKDVVLTQEVATRWYRAPQVLLGSQKYDKSADIWSIGCILAQILVGKPFFPGNSTLNQLQKILAFTGKPSKQDIYSLQSQVAQTMIQSASGLIRAKQQKDFFKSDCPPDAFDLVKKMLQFNPKRRPTISQVLKHSYLSQFRDTQTQVISKKVIQPPISDNKKLNLKQYRNLIYDNIKKMYPLSNNEEKPVSVSIQRRCYPQNQPSCVKQRQYRSIKTSQSCHQSASTSNIAVKNPSYHHYSNKNISNTLHSSVSQKRILNNSYSHINGTLLRNSGGCQDQKMRKKSSLKQLLRNRKSTPVKQMQSMKTTLNNFNQTGSNFYSNNNSNFSNNYSCSSGNLAQYKVYKTFLQKQNRNNYLGKA